MATRSKKDMFTQVIKLETTMSAANTITYAGITLGTPLFDFAGIVISRIEYFPGVASIQAIIGASDVFDMAITGSDSLTDFDIGQPEVFDRLRLSLHAVGTAASGNMYIMPNVHDFSNLAGGGLLVPAQEIYLGIDSADFVAAGAGNVRIYYTWHEMQAADYLELVQRLRILST